MIVSRARLAILTLHGQTGLNLVVCACSMDRLDVKFIICPGRNLQTIHLQTVSKSFLTSCATRRKLA
jgi:hypothetical protein